MGPKKSRLTAALRLAPVLSVLFFVPSLAAPPVPGRITIGCKKFKEHDILFEIIAKVVHATLSLEAVKTVLDEPLKEMMAGSIDLYVEYLGTALGSASPQSHEEQLRAEYKKNGISWQTKLGFRNPFVVVVRAADFKLYKTISQAAQSPRKWSIACGPNFFTRKDGLIKLLETYPLKLARTPVEVEIGRVYRSLEERTVDMVIGNSTDSMLDVLPIEKLTDDKKYFQAYDAWVLVRTDALTSHPGLGAALARLDNKISVDTMRRLLKRVEVEAATIDETAGQFVKTLGK